MIVLDVTMWEKLAPYPLKESLLWCKIYNVPWRQIDDFVWCRWLWYVYEFIVGYAITVGIGCKVLHAPLLEVGIEQWQLMNFIVIGCDRL